MVCPAQDEEEEVGRGGEGKAPGTGHEDNGVRRIVKFGKSGFSMSTFIYRNQVIGM